MHCFMLSLSWTLHWARVIVFETVGQLKTQRSYSFVLTEEITFMEKTTGNEFCISVLPVKKKELLEDIEAIPVNGTKLSNNPFLLRQIDIFNEAWPCSVCRRIFATNFSWMCISWRSAYLNKYMVTGLTINIGYLRNLKKKIAFSISFGEVKLFPYSHK